MPPKTKAELAREVERLRKALGREQEKSARLQALLADVRRAAGSHGRDPRRHPQLARQRPANLRGHRRRGPSALRGRPRRALSVRRHAHPLRGPPRSHAGGDRRGPARVPAAPQPDDGDGAGHPVGRCRPAQGRERRSRHGGAPPHVPDRPVGADAPRRAAYRRHHGGPARGRALHREADRPPPDLRRSGRHRHRERAPVHGAGVQQPRPDRRARPPDRHRRHPPGDQPGAGGCTAGLRGHRGQQHAPLRRLVRFGVALRGRVDSPGRRRGVACPAAAKPSWSSAGRPTSPGRRLSGESDGADTDRVSFGRRRGRLLLGRAVSRGGQDAGVPFDRRRADVARRRRGRGHRRHEAGGRRLHAHRDRPAPDLRRPGRDRGGERTSAQRAAGQERLAHRGPGTADGNRARSCV